jgi:hypothetical protein
MATTNTANVNVFIQAMNPAADRSFDTFETVMYVCAFCGPGELMSWPLAAPVFDV